MVYEINEYRLDYVNTIHVIIHWSIQDMDLPYTERSTQWRGLSFNPANGWHYYNRGLYKPSSPLTKIHSSSSITTEAKPIFSATSNTS